MFFCLVPSCCLILDSLQVWLSTFKAMLGETELFDTFEGTDYDSVATILLVMYIIILTIMMLNLLVAVLSTAHSRVDADADLEYKVGRFKSVNQRKKSFKQP